MVPREGGARSDCWLKQRPRRARLARWARGAKGWRGDDSSHSSSLSSLSLPTPTPHSPMAVSTTLPPLPTEADPASKKDVPKPDPAPPLEPMVLEPGEKEDEVTDGPGSNWELVVSAALSNEQVEGTGCGAGVPEGARWAREGRRG